MGLDMYLMATKHIEKINWGVLHKNEKFDLTSPQVINPQFNKLMEVTQLKNVTTDIYGARVQITCAYWRKANQIHNWFVANVQDHVDNCREYSVSQEQLKELAEICKQSLHKKDPSLLMPSDGFFFGGTDIDQYYWEHIKNTIEQLDRVLALPNIDDLWFYYQSSW
jgi:hypothetical protein